MFLMIPLINILEKLTQYGDEIKRLEDALQQSRESSDEKERLLKREAELKVFQRTILKILDTKSSSGYHLINFVGF